MPVVRANVLDQIHDQPMDDLSIAMREMEETKEDLANMQLTDQWRKQFERIRLDIAASPFVSVPDEVCKWILLAQQRALQQGHHATESPQPASNQARPKM